MSHSAPPPEGVNTPPDELSMKVRCPKCRTIFPVGVTMDDWGQIIDNPLDWVDFWAHQWAHGVVA